MSDPMENFESELSAMRPRSADQLSEQIATELARQKRADRRLIGAMGMGAMAACVIVVMLGAQSVTPVQPAPVLAVAPQTPHVGNDLEAFADANVLDNWK